MNQNRYTKPFIIACAINILFVLFVFWFSGLIFEAPPTTKKDTVIALDMSKYEVQGNDHSKPKSAPGGSSNKMNSDSSSKSATTTDNAKTPYVGGVVNSDVGVSGVESQGRVVNDGGGSPGTGSGSGGNGSGSGSGDGVGSGQNGGNGYVDLAGYIAKLNSIKQYPAQAVRRNLTGTAVFNVTFSAEGDVISVNMIASSGHSILDNAARHLIESGGRIINTTGQSTTEEIPITYELH